MTPAPSTAAWRTMNLLSDMLSRGVYTESTG